MLASAIRELAVSKETQWIAAAFFEKTIQIWEPSSQKKISEFPAVFRMGARNLAFSPSGTTLVTGKTAAHGGKIAAYEVPSGKKLWEQKLIFPRLLRFDPSGESILGAKVQ
jgi:WD40 repeat protein